MPIGELFENPVVAITIIGSLSLVLSLLVFAVGMNLRNRGKDYKIGEIQKNLKEMKSIMGEQSFTNLINGLPAAAKEELVFPEPIGVLRYKEFSRALTISVTITYFVILGYGLLDPTRSESFGKNPILQAFAWVFVAVIGFYFGDKIFENYTKSKGVSVSAIGEPIEIEAKVNENKKLEVTIKNNLKSKIRISKIEVDDKDQQIPSFEIEGEKSDSKETLESSGKKVKVEVGSAIFEKTLNT